MNNEVADTKIMEGARQIMPDFFTVDLSGLVSSEKVVVVSINYSLGIFGWLTLAQYGEPFKETTNLGLQEVIIGLQWI